MREKISFCVSSQTPLVRFNASLGDLYDKYGEMPEPLPLEMLTEGEDYVYAPGGVTRILPPLLKGLYERELIEKPHWVSLNPLGPETAFTESVILHSIELEPHESIQYGRFKESIWKNVHGVEQEPIPREDFPGYALYNWLTAKKMLDLHSEMNFDLFYVHDFQLLQAGSMLGPSAPKLFRWHIPIEIEDMLPQWRDFLLHYLDDYDCVIVSCKEYEEKIRKAGFEGELYQLYPHINPEDYRVPSYTQQEKFCDKFDIGEDDQVVLVVARLDPMKGQNIAIKGISHLTRKYPNLKLLLVGNGSFSSSKRGGLGLPKGMRWKEELDSVSNSLGISDRVIFTGYIPDGELASAFTRADVVVLPSILEGFGLTVLEGWQYKNPVIVSSKAGVAELIDDGENSYTFDPSNPKDLAEKIDALLSNSKHATEMGERGFETVKKCHLKVITKELWSIVEEVLEG